MPENCINSFYPNCIESCLEQLAEKANANEWAYQLTSFLIKREDWRSSRCQLSWKPRTTPSGIVYIQLSISARNQPQDTFNLLPTPTVSDGTWRSTRVLSIVNGKLWNRSPKGVRYGISISQLVEHGHYPPNTSSSTKNSDIQFPIGKKVKICPVFLCEMMEYPINWLSIPFQKAQT